MAESNITKQGNLTNRETVQQLFAGLAQTLEQMKTGHSGAQAKLEERRKERIAFEKKVELLEQEDFKIKARISEKADQLCVMKGKLRSYEAVEEDCLEDHENLRQTSVELDKELLKMKQESEAWMEAYKRDLQNITSQCKQLKKKNDPKAIAKLQKELEAKIKDIEEKQRLQQKLPVELGLDKENSVDLGEVYLAYYTDKRKEKL